MRPQPYNEAYVHIIVRDDRYELFGRNSYEVGTATVQSNSVIREPGYARWEWDGNQLTLVNCRYGLRPLYYFVRPNEICISTSILVLLQRGAPAELDDAALAVFLRMGFFVGDDTPFRAIRAVPPNVLFRWSRESFESVARFPKVQQKRISRDNALDLFITLFRESVAQRAPREPFVLPLSGGRDSRHILLASLANDHRPAVCVTARHYPPRPDEDERIARLLCKEFAIPHTVIDQGPSRVTAEIRKNRIAGLATIEHAWSLCIADWLADNATVVFDGIGGDSLAGAAQQDQRKAEFVRRGDLGRLADDLLDNFAQAAREPALENMLVKDCQKRFSRSLAKFRLLSELERHMHMPEPLSSFHFWNRVRRAIAVYSLQILPNSLQVIFPYLDDAIFDHMMSLPIDMISDKRFHTEAIHRGYPSARHIPFEDPEAPKKDYSAYHRRIGRDLAWFAMCHGRSAFVRTDRFVLRMVRYAVEGKDETVGWSSPLVMLYLLQLEAAIREPSVA